MDLHSLEWLKLSHNDLTRLTEDTVQPILDTLTMIDVSRESHRSRRVVGMRIEELCQSFRHVVTKLQSSFF